MKDILYRPFELELKAPMDICPRGMHSVSFFEFVYIVSGSGTQQINENLIKYKENDLFALAPQDSHQFFFETTTQLFFIRINNSHLKHISNHLFEKLELVLSNVNSVPGCVLKEGKNTAIAKALLNDIMREHQNRGLYSEELIVSYFEALLIIVARNVITRFPSDAGEKSDKRIMDILQYIQTNIYDPQLLRVSALSDKFNISANYLGKFFKKETGSTMQQYIDSYRLKLIENRLQHSDLRVNEIADQFNFTDKSHFIHFFKKHHNITPSKFKKNHQQNVRDDK